MGSPADTALERRLIFWRQVCGCQMGALCALVALGWYICGYDNASASTSGAVLRGVAVVITAGLLGKGAAVIVARAVYISEMALFIRRASRSRSGSRS